MFSMPQVFEQSLFLFPYKKVTFVARAPYTFCECLLHRMIHHIHVHTGAILRLCLIEGEREIRPIVTPRELCIVRTKNAGQKWGSVLKPLFST